MKILYYDCFAGISGDMNLGALVSLGVPAEYLITELKKLGLAGYELDFKQSLKMGISGTTVKINIFNTPIVDHDLNFHSHSQKMEHSKHRPNHDHDHKIINQHRSFKDIRKIINNSNLNSFVKEKSIRIFEEIAVAEAKIHAKAVDEVHFHEVGAIDSIVDIVGAALCIDYLKPDKILSSTIELGGGFVHCAHGVFPVPAPATIEILKDIPVKKGRVDKETTTPTGAAILKVFVDQFSDRQEFSVQKIAYGLGHRDLEIPNVLRVFLAEIKQTDNDISSAILVETNIDDMVPEQYEYVIDRLFEEGAQDVFMVPAIMKKSRPAIQLKVLCDEKHQPLIEKIILTETTSLGVRIIPVIKSMLQRKTRTVDTKYGAIRVKEAYYSGKLIKHKAEYDDCVLAARKASVTLKEVYSEVEECIKNQQLSTK